MYGRPYGYATGYAPTYGVGYAPGPYGVGQAPAPQPAHYASPQKQFFFGLPKAQQDAVRNANTVMHNAIRDLLAVGMPARWMLQNANRFVAIERGLVEQPIHTAWDAEAPSDVEPEGGHGSMYWDGSAWRVGQATQAPDPAWWTAQSNYFRALPAQQQDQIRQANVAMDGFVHTLLEAGYDPLWVLAAVNQNVFRQLQTRKGLHFSYLAVPMIQTPYGNSI